MPGWLSWLSVIFDSDHDPRVLGLSPVSSSLLSGELALPFPCAPSPALSLSLSLCQINKIFKKILILQILQKHMLMKTHYWGHFQGLGGGCAGEERLCQLQNKSTLYLNIIYLITPHRGAHLECRLWEKGNLVHCCWECKLIQLLRKQYGVPQKIKKELQYDPVIPLLAIYPKKMKILT